MLARHRLVGAENQCDRPVEHERRLAVDVGQRRIGGEPDDDVAARVADVVAAERTLGDRLAVAVRRPHADGDARQARHRLDDPHQLRRPERCGRKLRKRGAKSVMRTAPPWRSVSTVETMAVLRRYSDWLATMPSSTTSEKPFSSSPATQPAEHRIAVEARIAPPHQAARRLDQRGGAAVADDGKIEPVVGPAHRRSPRLPLPLLPLPLMTAPSRRRTDVRANAGHRSATRNVTSTPGNLAADRNRVAVEFRHNCKRGLIGPYRRR